MKEYTPTDRGRARRIVLVAGIAAAVAANAAEKPWHVPAGKALVFGAFGAIFINIAVFSINLVSSMRRWRHASSDEELARLAIPALHGKLNALGTRTVRVSAFLLAACIGVIAGALAAQLTQFAIALARS